MITFLFSLLVSTHLITAVPLDLHHKGHAEEEVEAYQGSPFLTLMKARADYKVKFWPWFTAEDSKKKDFLIPQEVTSAWTTAKTTNNVANKGPRIFWEPFQSTESTAALDRLKSWYGNTGIDTDLGMGYAFTAITDATPGGTSLAGLSAGGELFIIGHGNWGTALGNHDETQQYTEEEVVAKLVGAGFPTAPTGPIYIYWVACWGSVKVNEYKIVSGTNFFGSATQKSVKTTSDPSIYVFAGLMKAKTKDIKIIGWGGSVHGDRLDVETSEGNAHTPMNDPAVYSVYKIDSNSACTREHGTEYKCVKASKWSVVTSDKQNKYNAC